MDLTTLTVDELSAAQFEAMQEIIRLAPTGDVDKINEVTERVSAIERELISR